MTIQKKLLDAIKSDKAKAVETVGITGVSMANPLAGVILTSIHEIAGIADEVRIDAVIKGLSTELNQETQVIQLRNYIGKSEENAFYVANTLRKALLSDSPIACTIMGRILACHVNDGSKYSQDDNIIFHALENATDEDIRAFVRIMNQYRTKKGTFRIPEDIITSNVHASIEWCVYSRLFYGPSGGIAIGDISDEGFDTSHSPTSAAEKLYEYTDSVKQVFNWSNGR